ncbi:unnamed protein product [Cylicocyclus nassatus]|uniref:SCP domain-containing protein n=1 Tax=Cylicocyclus nassatus TaxID=53992 RepID=A0AA36HGW3_CYLNA|nr:unnamed protein product [Cylicocyclus nassatus]
MLRMQYLAIVIISAISAVEGAAQCSGGALDAANIETLLQAANLGRSELVRKGLEIQLLPLLPAANAMNQVYWSCNLEKKALASTKRCDSTETRTSAFNAVYVTMMLEQLPNICFSNGEQVKCSKQSGQEELNMFIDLFLDANVTEIGLAYYCNDLGERSVYWITNTRTPKDGDTLYEKGSGKCESCSAGTVCDSTTQLCARDATANPDFPTGANTKCPKNAEMTDELRMNYMDMHNYRRKLLANGEVAKNNGNLFPKAANMMKLELDCDLEADAIAYAGTCPKDVSHINRVDVGEHYHRVPVSSAPTPRDALKSAVTNWWKVVRSHPGPGVKEVTFRDKYIGQPIETFTQMGWAATSKLGCSVVKCSSDYVVICRYSPKGNIDEQKLYIPGTPCSKCPGKCYSDLGLCK